MTDRIGVALLDGPIAYRPQRADIFAVQYPEQLGTVLLAEEASDAGKVRAKS